MYKKDILTPISVKDVKPGSYVHLKNDIDSPIWIRNHYDRTSKSYSLTKFSYVNREIYRKPNTIVYITIY